MAEANNILYRIKNWFGGITDNVRDTRPGVHFDMQEVEIFEDKGFVRPTTILAADAVLTGRVTGYDLDDSDNLYAHSIGASSAPTIYKKTTASANAPGAWASYDDTTAGSRQTPLKWHQYTISVSSITRSTTTATLTTDAAHGLVTGDSVIIRFATESNFNGTKTVTVTSTTVFTYTVSDTGSTSETSSPAEVVVSYVYFARPGGLTKIITPTANTVQSTARNSTTMILPGYSTESDRIFMIRAFGELHIGCGQFISTIDETGTWVQKAFTLPDGWKCISADISGNYLAILAASKQKGYGQSNIFYWDLTATSGVVDSVKIPMGGPQIIFNYKSILWVVCAQNNKLNIYRINGTVANRFITLDNIPNETDDVDTSLIPTGIVPDASKFYFQDTICFGVLRTDKSGIYQLGQFDSESPFALVRYKSFTASFLPTNKPYAAISAGPNIYASHVTGNGETFDTANEKVKKLEGNNSPTFSSNARIDTVFIDAGKPELLKEWIGFLATTKTVPASCSIDITGMVDDATSFSTLGAATALNSSNSQEFYDSSLSDSLYVRDTYYRREWTNIVGRAFRARIDFTSNGSTARPTLIMLAPISTPGIING